MTLDAEDLRRKISRRMSERGRPAVVTLVADTPDTISFKFDRGEGVTIFVDVDRKTGQLAHKVERRP